MENLHKLLSISIDKPFDLEVDFFQSTFSVDSFQLTFSVDCERTREFNFDGIVTEAFEALGVGQGKDENMMMMIFIIIITLSSSLSS